MNNITATQVDRTFLYLLAVYAIHGILLHVFLMYPQHYGAKINQNIVAIGISNDWDDTIVRQTSNDSITAERNISIVIGDRITKWSEVNSDRNHVHLEPIMTNELLYQTKFSGSATCYSILSESESSYVKVMSCGSTMLENISPAILGITLGCMVFLFTDNINIP